MSDKLFFIVETHREENALDVADVWNTMTLFNPTLSLILVKKAYIAKNKYNKYSCVYEVEEMPDDAITLSSIKANLDEYFKEESYKVLGMMESCTGRILIFDIL